MSRLSPHVRLSTDNITKQINWEAACLVLVYTGISPPPSAHHSCTDNLLVSVYCTKTVVSSARIHKHSGKAGSEKS